MLQIIYRLTAIILLGVLGTASLLYFPFLVIGGIIFLIGVFVYAAIAGDEPTLGEKSARIRVLDALGKWTLILLLSPIFLPFWIIWQSGKLLIRSARKRSQIRDTESRRKESTKADAEYRAAALQANNERRRRSDRLFSCELFYNANETKLAERFKKSQLDDFVARYLQEGVAWEVFQERAGQLMRLMRQHLEAVEPPSSKSSLRELAEWYARQKQEIEELPVDANFREDYLVQLNERYAQLCQQALEEVAP